MYSSAVILIAMSLYCRDNHNSGEVTIIVDASFHIVLLIFFMNS